MGKRQLTHDEAVREVYRLTPQIRDYDEFMYMGVRWLAYTMFFHHKKGQFLQGCQNIRCHVHINDQPRNLCYLPESKLP